jgi:hypothetical protein
MKWHPSSIGNLMASPRNKTEALSEGAKTYIREIAKQNFYEYKSEIRTKPVMKGIDQELESIALLNAVRFTDYKKNNIRVETEYLSGECDIITEDSIIDVKTSWSLETFPAFGSEAHNSKYEWQGVAYMLLYDKPLFELVYCMISTDKDLLSDWDNKSIHQVDHIEPAKRITVLKYERNVEKEEFMNEKLVHASMFYAMCIAELNDK